MRNRFSLIFAGTAICLFMALSSAKAQVIPPITAAEQRANDEAGKLTDQIMAKRRQEEIDGLVASLSEKNYSKVFLGLRLSSGLSSEQAVTIFRKFLDHKSSAVRTGAALYLKQYGAKALETVPQLLAMLEKDVPRLERESAVLALVEIDPQNPVFLARLIEMLPRSPMRNEVLPRIIGNIGPAAESAIPALLAFINISWKGGWSHYEALLALAKINGGTATPAEVKQRLESLVQSQIWDKEMVGKQGLPTAVAFLALQKAGKTATNSLPLLVQLLEKRQEKYFKYAAVETMKSIGPGSSEQAVKLLLQIMMASGKDGTADNWELAEAADRALQQIGEGDIEAIAPLTEVLSHPERDVRYRAAAELAQIGAAARAAAPALVQALKDEAGREFPDPAFTGEVAKALINIGQRAATATDPLIDWLSPTSPIYKGKGVATWFRRYVFAIVAGVGLPQDPARRKEALQHAMEALRSDFIYMYAAGARLAGVLGPEAAPAVPLLRRAIDPPGFPDAIMTYLFQASMMAIPAATAKDRPFLDKHTHGGMPGHGLTTGTLEAIRALGRIGPVAAPAVPGLTKFAEAPDTSPLSFWREDARKAIQEIGGRQVADARNVTNSTSVVALNRGTANVTFVDLQNKKRQITDLRGQLISK